MVVPDPFSPLQHSRWLIRAAALLVPASYRESWRSEWEAEAWHAWRDMRDRGETSGFVRSQLFQFCRGSFADAAWYRVNLFDREEALRGIRHRMRFPGFCLGGILSIILVLGLASGFFPATRSILLPLPYANPARIPTIS